MNKLTELIDVVNKKEAAVCRKSIKKVAATDLKKKAKENMRLQFELTQERKRLNEAQEAVSEAEHKIRQMQMESDAKDSRIEELLHRVALNSSIVSYPGNGFARGDEARASGWSVNTFRDDAFATVVAQSFSDLGEARPGQ